MREPSWAEAFCTWMVWRLDGTSLSWKTRSHLPGRAMLYQNSLPTTVIAEKISEHRFCSQAFYGRLDPLDCYLFQAFSLSIALLWSQFAEVALKVKISPFAAWSRSCSFCLILTMASNSSSSSGLSVEARIESLESSMGRIRARLEGQEKKLEESSKAGDKTWDLLNEDIRKLREDHATSAEKMEEFKDEVRTGFKDEANVHGDFGK